MLIDELPSALVPPHLTQFAERGPPCGSKSGHATGIADGTHRLCGVRTPPVLEPPALDESRVSHGILAMAY